MSDSIAVIIYRNVQSRPNRKALVFGSDALSYRQMWDRVGGVCSDYRSSGLSAGDAVGLLLENSLECAIQLVAAAAMGLVIAPLPAAMSGAARKRALEAADCKAAVAKPAVAANIARDSSLDLDVVFAVGGEADGCACIDMQDESLPQFGAPPEIADDVPYIVTMTSGSTGAPKPIVFSQQTKLRRAFDATRDVYGLGEDEVVLVSTPMHHSLAQRSTLLPLLLGGTAIILERFTPSAWVDAVRDFGVTFMFSVSSQLKTLLPLLSERGSEVVSLRTVVSSSALLDDDTKRQLLQMLTCDLHECYGASEVGCATDFSVTDSHARMGSVGRALPHVQIKVCDPGRNELPVGSVGEIAVRSTTEFAGYYKKPDLTRAAYDSDGYFYTGDLGYLDDKGWLFFKGRLKEVIIAGGINVYPKDIEDVLSTCTGVADAAVIGVNDEYFGEAILALLVWKPDFDVTLLPVQRRCAAELADYQRPMAFEALDELPRNAMGKVDKLKLAEQFQDYDATSRLRALLLGGTN